MEQLADYKVVLVQFNEYGRAYEFLVKDFIKIGTTGIIRTKERTYDNPARVVGYRFTPEFKGELSVIEEFRIRE